MLLQPAGNENNSYNVTGTHGNLIEFPVNNAVKIGSQSVLSCSLEANSTKHIQWYYIAPRSSSKQFIYTGYGLNESLGERYNVKKYVDGRCELVVSHTGLSDAGTYACHESRTKSSTSQLIVFGKTETFRNTMHMCVYVSVDVYIFLIFCTSVTFWYYTNLALILIQPVGCHMLIKNTIIK